MLCTFLYALPQLPPEGWIKLRQELQPASALPSASSFLHGEAGHSGSHGHQGGQAASAAGSSAPGSPWGLSAAFELAMRQRLESAGRGLSHLEYMLIITAALDLLPSVLDGMRTALSPVYPDRRGQGAQGDNVWVRAKPAGTGKPIAVDAATLLKDLAVPHPGGPVYTANVAIMHWPQLTTCKPFPAWGCLFNQAAQSPSAQPVSTSRRIRAAPLHRLQAALPFDAPRSCLHAAGLMAQLSGRSRSLLVSASTYGRRTYLALAHAACMSANLFSLGHVAHR